MAPHHVAAAQRILATMRRLHGSQHIYRPVDPAQFSHLSMNYYTKCEQKLNELSFRKIMDSLVLAFEQALHQKADRVTQQGLTEEELIVIAIEALEREVNNGGYHQLFTNSSKEYASFFVTALNRIACHETALLTQQAIDALGIKGSLTIDAIEIIMGRENEELNRTLAKCDDQYYKTAGDLAGPLLVFIKNNREKIRIRE